MGNASGNGFWRTHHDDELMDNLLAHLGELEPIERYLVVDDTWADLLAGRVEVSRVVEVCEAMTDDRHPAVWRRLGGVFGGLRRLIANDHLDQFQAWVRSVSFVALEDAARLAHDGDAAAQDLYAVLFGIAGVTGADPATQQAARELLAADPAKVDANLLASATGVVAAGASAAEHRDLMARWRAADNPQEEVRFLYALVDTPSREDFEATLDLVTNEVRTQNAPYVLMRVEPSHAGCDRLALPHRPLGRHHRTVPDQRAAPHDRGHSLADRRCRRRPRRRARGSAVPRSASPRVGRPAGATEPGVAGGASGAGRALAPIAWRADRTTSPAVPEWGPACRSQRLQTRCRV